MEATKSERPYVLVTAAHNEEALIGSTIRAIISQTLLPRLWVIVSDASTDRTDKIVQEYAKRYNFIELVRVGENHALSFASKVHAVNKGLEILGECDYDFIGNLDADISFETSYFADLLEKFERDASLGLAGGFIYEEHRGKFTVRFGNSVRSVAGAVQLFRRECYKSVGAFIPLKYGGEDWCAEIRARMQGWRVEAFPELKVFHHRATGTAVGALKYCFGQGVVEYSLGSSPWFVICKSLRRLPARPYFLAALAILVGFVWARCRRQERPVPRELVEYLREEQRTRIRDFALRVVCTLPNALRFGR